MIYSPTSLAKAGILFNDRRTIVNLIKSGQLKAKVLKTKRGTRYIITEDNINEFLGE